MPRNGLTLTVLIGSQPNHFSLFRQFPEFFNNGFLVVRYRILRFVSIVEVDTQIRFVQIAYMAITGTNQKIGSQKTFDGFGFGR